VAGKQPNVAVRIVANALVSLLVAWLVAKLFGKRAGIGAALVGVVAHEILNQPVANAIYELVR
jgi:uncharacterized membrane protein YvlD (DUF360 family)